MTTSAGSQMNAYGAIQESSRGNFAFVDDKMTRKALQNAFEKIEQAGLWNKVPKERTRKSLELLMDDTEFKEKVVEVIERENEHSNNSL